jgi:hypothetical protein
MSSTNPNGFLNHSPAPYSPTNSHRETCFDTFLSRAECCSGHHKPINHFQRAGLLKRRVEKFINLLHAHSIFRWLDLLNKRTANCLNKRINSKPLNLHPYSVNDSSTLKASADGSIVITLAPGLTLTIIRAQSGLYGVHYCGGNRAHYNS